MTGLSDLPRLGHGHYAEKIRKIRPRKANTNRNRRRHPRPGPSQFAVRWPLRTRPSLATPSISPALTENDLNGTALSPIIVLAGLEAEEGVYYHLWVAVRKVIEESNGSRLDRWMVQSAMERFVVELGMALYERTGGPQLTFVDPRKNDDAAAIVRSAKRLISLFRAQGMSQEKIVISIPATEDGVAAAKELEAAGIHTNLIFVANIVHAAICAQAGATTISIAVGPLLHCHERKRNALYPDLALHPGMEIIQATLEYFKLHKIRTRIVGRDFRQLAELSALSGFDAVCLSKEQLEVSCWKAETRSADLCDRPPQASMRARQVQHPTKFLENGIGFMSVMSAEARSMLAATIYPVLGKMELQMNAIERIVREEVAWQLAQKTLSLDTLYDLRAPPSSPATKKREDGARAGSEKRRKPRAGAWEQANEGGLIEGVEYF
ncbi:hypothetical protein K438DRAFT_1813405 [Mycena galopus ATCC 62051]|nr:hypothetical protein K438DRAFT_1813405 [Mycena galopus ATCC 62051]